MINDDIYIFLVEVLISLNTLKRRRLKCKTHSLRVCLGSDEKISLLEFLAYFCYYLWVSLHFLELSQVPLYYSANIFNKRFSVSIKKAVPKRTQFHKNSFQFFNFAFVHFSPLSFNFIQLIPLC